MPGVDWKGKHPSSYTAEQRRRMALRALEEVVTSHEGWFDGKKYNGLKYKMPFRCSKGHEFDTLPATVLRGHWCLKCSKPNAILKTSRKIARYTIEDAKKITNLSLELHPRNLLLNQFKIDLKNNNNLSAFNCKKEQHVVAEILYITSNALSSQSVYPLSNFYLNLAKYLNNDFHSFDTLLAENFYKIKDFEKAKKIYNNLSSRGMAFHWYSSKQLARIHIQKQNKRLALQLMEKSYNNLLEKDIYETFDYAEFLKNNEKFEASIPLYTEIINKVETKHPLYAEATDGRGIAYERTGEWIKAEKDLQSSLEADPDQAYVINYLAYSWIEKGIKVEKSLRMLEKANRLRSNDPYITDSLGWALFKLERYKESKTYLQLAVRLLPDDPIVNDHYGDVLWKNGNEIQARYYWKYVLSLKKTENELKKIVENKLIRGL